MKKFLSIFMVIVMITSLTVVNAAADTLGDRIANQVFALDAKDKTMFVELVQLYSDVDNKEALADAYEAAFESLAPGQQQRVSSFGGTIAAVSGFATFLAGEADDQAIDNMAQYLNQNDKDAFIAAINRRESDFRADCVEVIEATMTDVHSAAQRSFNMSRIGSRDTKPELIVRSIVHQMGFRFRLHRRDLPGKPDIVLPSRRKIIFVHGCFWHTHRCRYGKVTPATNAEFWKTKRAANSDRDRRNIRRLRVDGWQVLVVWECWTKNIDQALIPRLQTFLGESG